MAEIDTGIYLTEETTSPTLLAMQRHWKQSTWIRNLGASNIGHHCDRKIWLQWRYAVMPDFPPRLLRLFDRGHREEPVFIDELRSAGVEVYGEQEDIVGYKGHFVCHPDGRAMGILEAPKTEHLLEFKTMSDKYFKEMEKKGCEKAKPEYYAQMQIQMHLTGMTRAYFLAVNKNDDNVYAERIKYDKIVGERLQTKVERIIDATQPPECNRDWKCKWCDMRGLCFPDEFDDAEKTPQLNCRTCCFSTPIEGGRWVCSKYNDKEIPKEFQLKGCSKHLLIPGILEDDVTDTDGETYVEYGSELLNFNDEYVSPDDGKEYGVTLTHGVPF